MKIKLLYFLSGFSLLCISTMTGCIDDHELEFPEPKTAPESIALISLLNYFENSPLTNSACFEPVFPIELAYNNGIIIEIQNMEGLIEAVNAQSEWLYINGLILPVLVKYGNTIKNITTEEDLLKLMSLCDIPNLRTDLSTFFTQCFGIEYPVTMISHDSSLVVINNLDELANFKKKEGTDYFPRFNFPITIEEYQSDQKIVVYSYFDLYQIIERCDRCPTAAIRIDKEFDGSIKFIAEFDNQDHEITFDWYINNDYIKSGNAASEDTLLHVNLDPGNYEVCIKSYTDDCVLGVYKCIPVEIINPCPELFFRSEDHGNGGFTFIADFERMSDIEYTWTVGNDSGQLYNEIEYLTERDNKLFYQFEPGVYDICIETETEGCPEVTRWCKVITVPQ